MDELEWRRHCDAVTDEMREHTRPFVTGLSHRASGHRRLFGSGTYVLRSGQRLLLTCEHVARHPRLEMRLWPGTKDYVVPGEFTLRPDPDLTWCEVPDDMWLGIDHKANAVPYERLASRHHVGDQSEL